MGSTRAHNYNACEKSEFRKSLEGANLEKVSFSKISGVLKPGKNRNKDSARVCLDSVRGCSDSVRGCSDSVRGCSDFVLTLFGVCSDFVRGLFGARKH